MAYKGGGLCGPQRPTQNEMVWSTEDLFNRYTQPLLLLPCIRAEVGHAEKVKIPLGLCSFSCSLEWQRNTQALKVPLPLLL